MPKPFRLLGTHRPSRVFHLRDDGTTICNTMVPPGNPHNVCDCGEMPLLKHPHIEKPPQHP